jgi:hypothetical protein
MVVEAVELRACPEVPYPDGEVIGPGHKVVLRAVRCGRAGGVHFITQHLAEIEPGRAIIGHVANQEQFAVGNSILHGHKRPIFRPETE